MSEEEFFSMFVEELREAVKNLPLPEPKSSWARSLYLSKWNPQNAYSKFKGVVVACDGSPSESSFSGGLVALVARAVAHIYKEDGSVKNVPRFALKFDYKLRGRSLFMKALEVDALRKGIERALEEHKHVFAVFDGSLYLTFFHYPPVLETIAEVFEKYVRELSSIIKLTQENNVKILGISKDSDISYLRAKIILDALLQANPQIGDELALRGRRIKWIVEKLRQKVNGLPEDALLRGYLKEFELEISDEELYDQIVSEPGFTTPLLLAPQTYFLREEIKKETVSWWESRFRKVLERNGKLSSIIDALDSFYSLPPMAVFYWKPKHGFGVYRVDTPANLLGHKGKCGDLPEDVFTDNVGIEKAGQLVETLNSLSHTPYTVKPLTEVDAAVRLDRGLYKQAYEPVITEELRKKGFRVNPRKRSIRDLVLRGY